VTVRTLGVEEEFLLVDPASGRPRAVGKALLASADAADRLTTEFQLEQLETSTKPCLTLDELGRQLRSVRATAAAAAADIGWRSPRSPRRRCPLTRP
jgi:glutamate---cysteine ligase / carboxylate-amine ligase